MVPEGVGAVTDAPLKHSVLTTCPFCACGCGLYLHCESSRVVGVAPSQNHPVSQGRLCARGWASHEAPTWGPRLLTPSLRHSEGLRPASWSDALQRATEELRRLLSAGKRIGVLVSGACTNEESYLAMKLARGALRTGNVDGCGRMHYEALLRALGGRDQAWDSGCSLREVEESDRILLLEGDLSLTHPRAAFAVLRALRKGARLVTMGWARTNLSQLASSHFPLDPAHPGRVPPELPAALGLDREGGLRTSVLLAPFSPSTEALSATVRGIAEALVPEERKHGSSVNFLPLPYRANSRGAWDMGATPGHLPGGRPLEDGTLGDRLRTVWGAALCTDDGLAAEAMVGQVDGLVVLRDDLSAALPLPGAALGALRGLESLIVLDAFRSSTSDAATVVLPLAAFSEMDGTLTSGEGRVQRIRAAARPIGESRPGWAVLAGLLDGLGVRSDYPSFSEVFSEIGRVVPGYEALSEGVPEEGWGGVVAPTGASGDGHPQEDGRPRPHASDLPQGTHWLALEGAFDWEDDPVVECSPTLRRDGAARRKLNPDGLVTMNPADGRALGIRAGWAVRLRSRHGEVLVPVSMNSRVEEGVLLAPFVFREALAQLLGGGAVERVEVQRT